MAALGVIAAASLVAAAPAVAAPANNGHGRHVHRAPHIERFFGGQLYVFSGTVAVAPGASPTVLQVTVTGGNRPALRALVGNTTEPLSFAVNARTSYVDWTAGARANMPTSTTPSTIAVGDPVHLRIRARYGLPLATLLATPTRMVNDFAAAQKVAGRLFLFAGRAVSVDTTASTITVDIKTGNWFALNALLGQPTTETFHYDASTLFLSWNRRSPHSFDPSQIKPGDPITVRTRAAFGTPLATLLSAPLWKVNDHEPISSLDTDGGALPVGN